MHDDFDIQYTKKYRSVYNVKIKLKIVSASSVWVFSDFEFDLYIEYGTEYDLSKWSCINSGVADVAVFQNLTL